MLVVRREDGTVLVTTSSEDFWESAEMDASVGVGLSVEDVRGGMLIPSYPFVVVASVDVVAAESVSTTYCRIFLRVLTS